MSTVQYTCTVSSSAGGSVGRASVVLTLTTLDLSTQTTYTETVQTLQISAITKSGNTTSSAQAASALTTSLSSSGVKATFNGTQLFLKTGAAPGNSYVPGGTHTVTRTTSNQTMALQLTVVGRGSNSINITVPARTSWDVTYDANSGTGAPSAQKKYYDYNLTLSTGVPIKADHTFKGWATSAPAAGEGTVSYASGATYSANDGLSLVATWERNYQKPTITNLRVDRCRQNGDLDDDGAYAKVTFEWAVLRTDDKQYYGGSSAPYSSNGIKTNGCVVTVGSTEVKSTPTGASGTYSGVIGSGNFDSDTSYAVSVSITDSQLAKTAEGMNTTIVTGQLPTATFPIDINADATAIAFLSTAPDDAEGIFFGKNVDAPSYSISGAALIDFFYPVGSYYETSDASFNPNNAWGGTWEEDTSGRMLVAAGTNAGVTYSTGSTGGSKDMIVPYHNHGFTNPTIASSGAHVHTLNQRNAGTTGTRATNNVTYGASGHDYQTSNAFVSSGAHSHSYSANGSVGYAGTSGNATNANMPPYIVVKRWHRTA